jgi:signal transduction histidine kinase
VARQQEDEEAAETSIEAPGQRRSSSRSSPPSSQRKHASAALPVTHRRPRPEPDGSGKPATSPSVDQALDRLDRLDRLEAGMRVMAQTFKRAFDELHTSLERLRADVALTATAADVERSVAHVATPADVAHGAARAVEQLRSSLQQMAKTSSVPSPAALRVALNRLAEGIEDVQTIVEESLDEERLEKPIEPDPATNGSSGNGPDPSAIWGDEVSTAAEFGPDDGPRDHRKRSPTRRRLEHSWPGRAYSNWKYRRSELK